MEDWAPRKDVPRFGVKDNLASDLPATGIHLLHRRANLYLYISTHSDRVFVTGRNSIGPW